MANGRFEFPQVAPTADLDDGERGITSLYHPDVGTFRFRSNPKDFNWSYTLNKRVDQTYGGRVIQLLGTSIDDFSFTADCGSVGKDGGWPYMNRAAKFLSRVMIEQRKGVPATFEYTTRGWNFRAFIVSIPFADAVEEVLREFTVSMKVQEDVSGVMSQNTLQAELNRLKDGMGFQRSKYNDPLLQAGGPGAVPDAERFQNGFDRVLGFVQGFASEAGLDPVLNPSFITSTIANGGNGLLDAVLGPNSTTNSGGN
jgi:hypothetical protein